MRIAVLGCGYVGEAAAIHWKKEGLTVTATTRQSNRIAYLQTIADHVFLLGPQPFGLFLSTQDALLISVAPDASSDYASTYLHTALLVAKEASRTPSLKQILYTSSLSVYGDHKEIGWMKRLSLPL